MIPAQHAIARLRRDLTVGTALNIALAVVVIICIALPMRIGGFGATILLTAVGALWLALSYQSIKGSRLAAVSPQLIASGKLDAAEHQIETALRSFSLFRTGKLLSLHHLALLRHAQRRWEDSAQLSRELIKQRLGSLKHLERQSRLILTEALLEMGDLNGAYQSLSHLYQQRLSLSEAMNLLLVQLEYDARINAWERIFNGVSTKAQIAELMPADRAARVQAWLALAARKLGHHEWATWLRKRVELLTDVSELTKSRPALWELWSA